MHASRVATHARRIVVGYDGTEPSRRALEVAADLAGYGSSLAVVTVAPRRGGDADGGAVDPDAVRHGEGLLAEARERLLGRHVTARYIGAVGDPAERLVETARDLQADLLVVGRRNGDPHPLLPGPASATILRTASCDVLVVR